MKSYAVYNIDGNIVRQSSSGGVFYAIASSVIKNGGIVCAAIFDNSFNVVHSFANSIDELIPMLGSKYVQSNLGDTYKIIKKYITEGRTVFFAGTPCQVGGLKKYIGQNARLITMDFVCHGVPSPKVWHSYIGELQNNRPLKAINFRDKRYGWKKFTLSFLYKDGHYEAKPRWAEPYMKCFLRDLDLRPSCYSCSFKGIDRISDITLADLWGASSIDASLSDDKGYTLVVVHTPIGEEILKNSSDSLNIRNVELEMALKHNRYMINSVPYNASRFSFMSNFPSLDVVKYMNKCTPVSIKQIFRMKRAEWSIGAKLKRFKSKMLHRE